MLASVAGWGQSAERDIRDASATSLRRTPSDRKSLRVPVASTADLARMLAAFGRESDVPKLLALRRLLAPEHTLNPERA